MDKEQLLNLLREDLEVHYAICDILKDEVILEISEDHWNEVTEVSLYINGNECSSVSIPFHRGSDE